VKRSLIPAFLGLLLSLNEARAATPVMRVVKATPAGESLLANGSFEQRSGDQLAGWQAAPKGYRVAAGEGRNGSQALACENASGDGWFGASQTLQINRADAAPLVVRGWSKAEGVTGSADSGYSLYVDIVYADGTPLWGQTASFRCGTHDWAQREFVILPERPVRTLTLHCLFRGHAGRAWFDDVSVEETKARGNAVLLQGIPIEQSPMANRKSQRPTRTCGTLDGLKLSLRDNALTSLQVLGRQLTAPTPSGFLARDVAANSDVFAFEQNACRDLQLRLSTSITAASNHISVQGRVTDTTGQDRAITLLFALPLDANGWRWGDDIHRSRVIQGNGEFANQIAVRCGATGTMALYPLATVWDDRDGLALALDMAQPAVCRLGYHAGTKQLFVAYDFGLVKDSERCPSSAEFRFVIYRFDPRWGFRAAFQKLIEIFPDYFVVRSKDQGLWMPFTHISTVQGWQDFGFRYHEGNNNVPWDDANGILSFRYTEPMTWWMRMNKRAPRTLAEAIRARDELAQGPNNQARQMAQVSQVAAMHDETGQPCLLFRNEPWCDGAVWSLNPNPWLGEQFSPAATATTSTRVPGQETRAPMPSLNAATVHWSDTLKDALYGPMAKGSLDGEYLDSLEGYVTADLNFRREHFRYTTVPFTFSSDVKQAALFKGLTVFEFTKWFCDDVHRLGKLTFANGVPYRFTFLCPWLDVLGTETDWLRSGRYQPASISQMDLWRTMSGQKPYLLLMNTDYDAFTPELVEKYFQRCLLYGMWPGMFSHNASENPYWQNPKWYNRDRPLFMKYIPLIKRVAEAGWQPVTEATCDNAKILVERFGPDAHGTVYLTLFNDTAETQRGTLTLNLAVLRLPIRTMALELISEKPAERSDHGWVVELQPQVAAVLELRQ
jgi:hypothetical protein